MSVLYNQFSIIDITTDLKEKKITIVTNFKIDASTVNLNTVSLYNYGAGNQLMNYSLAVEGKEIHVILNDYPAHGTKLYLRVTDIYDALNRKLNYAYNDYVAFEESVITDVEVLSPGFRETFTQNFIDIKLRIKDPLKQGKYRVQISADNAFFKLISTIITSASDNELTTESDDVSKISSTNIEDGILHLKTTIDYNGQLYIRARAELSDQDVGQWSELGSFTICTIPVESMDTAFLEGSLTTSDLFPEEFELISLDINEKSNIVKAEDGLFYIEFNKEIKLPDDYELDEDGYVSLGVITGFRKELK